MNKINSFILNLLIILSSFTWEILQNVAGLICLIFIRLGTQKELFEMSWYKGEILILGNFFNSGVSLGRFIFLDYHHKNVPVKITFENAKDHEWGHSRQSLMLGPFYLFVVGIPSALHNLYNRSLTKLTYHERMREYYAYWCEKWADKLGKVSRVY